MKMRKLYLTTVILLLLNQGMNAQTATAPSSGNGTIDNPYEISGLGNLFWIADDNSNWNKHYVQTTDINAQETETWFDGAGWLPIGNTTTFTGTYNGQNNTIYNLYISRPAINNVGLFGHVGQGTANSPVEIINLHLVNVNVTGGRGAGTLAGRVTGNIYTLIEGCSASGADGMRNVKGDAAVGGLVGSNNSFRETPGGTDNPIISKSWADIDVIYSGVQAPTGLEAEKYGGLAGCNQKGNIFDSYAKGSVTAHKNSTWSVSNVGGLAGCILYRGRIEKSYSTGQVSGDNTINKGGLVGNVTTGGNAGVVVTSYWDIQSSGLSVSAGGTGLNTLQMKDVEYLEGFDFNSIWKIDVENNGYPSLRNVPVTTYLTWTGAVSTDWKDAGNWNLNRTPVASDIAIIPEGLPRYPVIDEILTSLDTPKGLTIEFNAGITIESDGVLSISDVILSSAGTEGLLIKSDQNGTGSLIHSSPGLPATVQRFIGSADWGVNSNGWHFVSSPVAGQAIAGSWTPSGVDNNYDFFAWEESEVPLPWINQKDNPNMSEFNSGQGYLIAYQQTDTKTFAGPLHTGVVSSTLKNSSGTKSWSWSPGWNLIGNPYASAIDWHLADRSYFNDEFAYIYNTNRPGGANYEFIDGSTVNAIIPAHQGFFVKAIADANNQTFTFTNNMRAHGHSFYKSEPNDKLVLRLASDEFFDECIIRIREKSNFNRDRLDALKMFSFDPDVPQLFTKTNDGVWVAVNSLPAIQESLEIPVSIKLPGNGPITLSIAEKSGKFTSELILLHDLKTGITHNLGENPQYTFTGNSSDDNDRFLIKFSNVGSDETQTSGNVQVYAYNNLLFVLNPGHSKAQVEVYNVQGQLVLSKEIGQGLQSLEAPVTPGAYIVRMISAEETATRKVIIQ